MWDALLILPLSELDESQGYESKGFCLLFQELQEELQTTEEQGRKEQLKSLLRRMVRTICKTLSRTPSATTSLRLLWIIFFSAISSLSGRAPDLVIERTSNGIVVNNTRVFLAEFLRVVVDENASLSSIRCLKTVPTIFSVFEQEEQEAAKKLADARREAERNRKKAEMELVKQGKRPFFLKKCK